MLVKVPDTVFEEEGMIKEELGEDDGVKNNSVSADPFNLYPLLHKKNTEGSNKKSDISKKYPPGFTPKEGSIGESINKDSGTGDNGKDGNDKGEQSGIESKNDSNESVCSGHFKKSEKPHTGGSILNVLDDVVKVGQVMGYKMDGCIANMAEIIESQGEADGTGDNGKDGNDKGEQSGMKSKNDSNEYVCYGHFKKSEKPRTGGSILNVLDD
nr:RNA-directed DNA polymerase, eukaryota, reverse transcriptase zinc-binding domain protein [Tanacetum cinerariifolium]